MYEARVKTQPHPELPKPQITLLPDTKEETTSFIVMKEILRSHPNMFITYEKSAENGVIRCS